MAIKLIKFQDIITKSDLLDMLYPIGTIYISCESYNPFELLGGIWESLPEGYSLWTNQSVILKDSKGNEMNRKIEAGLPNITGFINNQGLFNNAQFGGSFYDNGDGMSFAGGTKQYTTRKMGFDASRTSNSLYGKSSTVQPPAYRIFAWRRIE